MRKTFTAIGYANTLALGTKFLRRMKLEIKPLLAGKTKGTDVDLDSVLEEAENFRREFIETMNDVCLSLYEAGAKRGSGR